MIISILSFLFVSFGYSLFEKLKDKQGYVFFLREHIKIKNMASFFWWFLVFINSITSFIILYGIISVIFNLSLVSADIIYITISINILVLLLGQRIAGDFQGAANLGIYMIINIMGWYLHAT